jgi:hypothetical protein
LDSYIEEYKKLSKNKRKEYKTCKKEILPEFKKKWSEPGGKIKMVSGKQVFPRLSDMCKKEYGVSFGSLHWR